MAEYNQESWSNMVKILYVVIPCYNEEEALPFFYEEMSHVMEEMNFFYKLGDVCL